MGVDVLTAFERSMKTMMEWICQEVNTEKTHVSSRIYAHVHFRFVSCLSPSIVWINLYKLKYLALMVEYHKKRDC